MTATVVPSGTPTSTSAQNLSGERLQFLDALRGVAILLVLVHHAYVRWTGIVPYGGERFNNVPPFAPGAIGVELFFMISGFVIFMSLEKSPGFGVFLYRRWLRLFPAMLFCSLLIFATASFFPWRPNGIPSVRDLISGLIFVDPLWITLLFQSPQGVLEGVFWSLFVEVKFYLLVAFVYFFLGRHRAIPALLGAFAISVAVKASAKGLLPFHISPEVERLISGVTSFEFFGWFAAGALFYRYFHERKPYLFILAVFVSLLAAVAFEGFKLEPKIAALSVAAVFAATVYSNFLQRQFANRALLFFGAISYPLYLVHDNMMVSMIVSLHGMASWIPYFALPILPIMIVVGIAWLVATKVEARLRNRIRSGLRLSRNWLVARWSVAR